VIIIESVDVQLQDSALLITVQYIERRSQVRGIAQISVPGELP
jgi:hypothetical protein